jgi:hypothetical protein
MSFALSNYSIHYSFAVINANAAAVAHAPREAMELRGTLSKNLLPKAYAA